MADNYRLAQLVAEQTVRYCEQGMNLQMVLSKIAEAFPAPEPRQDPPMWRSMFSTKEQDLIVGEMIEEHMDRSSIKDDVIEELNDYGEPEMFELMMYVDPDLDTTLDCLKAIRDKNADMDDYRSGEHADHFVAAQFIERFDLVQNAEELSDRGKRYIEEYG